MKVLEKVVEVSGEGLESLLGKTIVLFCANYFYTGTLVGVNTTCVKLADPYIIYDTGDFKDRFYANSQSLHTKEWYIQTNSIESFGVLK